VSQPWIPRDERSGLLTHIAATESVLLRMQRKADGFSGTRIRDLRFRGRAGVC
jgi:hypothetical protein